MIKLGISGAHGRMGQAIYKIVKNDPRFKIAALLEHPDHPKVKELIDGHLVSTNNAVLADCDVVIEFTLPEGTMKNLEVCVKHGVSMVIGTTGLSTDQKKVVETASQKIALIYGTNMSIGVNVMFKAIELASKKLKNLSAIQITETHHVHKKDAPSGTAKTMSEIAEKFSGVKIDDIASIREGEVVGYHKIIFETEEDTLVMEHNAKDRTMFAKGAVEAAAFLSDKKRGVFTMFDVLGLN